MGSWETKRVKLDEDHEPYKELVIKYQKIQGNCLKEATKKKNVAENVKVASSAMENIAKSNQKGLESQSKIKSRMKKKPEGKNRKLRVLSWRTIMFIVVSNKTILLFIMCIFFLPQRLFLIQFS